jgi:hypothetical protein
MKNKMEFVRTSFYLLACLIICYQASAQIVGVDICDCQPSTITFRVDFSFDCDGSNVAGPGIDETTCNAETRGNENVTDFVPTLITTVQIFELDENFQPVSETNYDAVYFDGAGVTYTTIVERAPDKITTATLPRGFQVVLTGLNAAEQNIVTLLAIRYTGGTCYKSCNRFSRMQLNINCFYFRMRNLPALGSGGADRVDCFCKYCFLLRKYLFSEIHR